ncbi:MAG: hypothetical protein IID40_10300 [Planctomycetes bacterium]|nr:hypothetical protein [Planctomycetota bacterium]
MTTSCTEAFAAPTRVTVAGKDYELHPLRFRDWGQLEQFLRDKIVDLGRRSMERATDPADKDRIMATAYRAGAEVSLTSDDPVKEAQAQVLLSAPDTLIELVYLSVRRGQPAFTRDHAEDLCDTADSVKELAETIMRISRGGSEKNPPEAAPGAGQ